MVAIAQVSIRPVPEPSRLFHASREGAAVVEEDVAGGAAEEGVAHGKIEKGIGGGRRSNTVPSSLLVRSGFISISNR
jgi:hypothetical protein